jgi:hypothetical protein
LVPALYLDAALTLKLDVGNLKKLVALEAVSKSVCVVLAFAAFQNPRARIARDSPAFAPLGYNPMSAFLRAG